MTRCIHPKALKKKKKFPLEGRRLAPVNRNDRPGRAGEGARRGTGVEIN